MADDTRLCCSARAGIAVASPDPLRNHTDVLSSHAHSFVTVPYPIRRSMSDYFCSGAPC